MKSAAASVDEIASLSGVSFTYRDGFAPALLDVDLALRAGEMVGIMGASGAGKSSLVKCLNRLIPAFEDGNFRGVAQVGGHSSDDLPVCAIAPMVGMVFQDFEAQLFSTNVRMEVAFAMQQMGIPREEIERRIAPALESVGLSGFEARDPTSLSGGEKQRLAIASVLALRPRVIVFDEPTTDLDPEGRAEVLELIQKLRGQGLAIVLIEHEAEALRSCDRILLMREGRIIAQDAPAKLMSQIELLEKSGVRPPDLNRAFAALEIDQHPSDIDQAEVILRRALKIDQSLDVHAVDQPAPDRGAPLVQTRDLCFAYPGGAVALDSIDLAIHERDFLAIVGQNGSGKTTLAKHLVGLLKPSRGEVLLGGSDRAALSPAATARTIGYVFQNPDHQIFAPTVQAEVAFGPQNFGLAEAEVERRVHEVLEAVNLADRRDRDPFLLSKGERQRLAVASVLALRPRMLVLDEPTTGLDYREQLRLMDLITKLNREQGIGIVIITHTPWLVAEYARRAVLLRKGRKFFDGSVRDFFRQTELLRASSFRPPEITRLADRFGFPALSVSEFVQIVRHGNPAESI